MIVDQLKHSGFMFVISSPSGVGKTTICRNVLESDKSIEMSVSVTTRKMRAKETQGVDYYFVTDEQFKRMVAEEQFLEYANVFGEFYGTPRQHVEANLNKGVDVLFDIDWQGARQLRGTNPENVVTLFLLPPSMSELSSRINKRGQDTKENIALRLNKAKNEIAHWREYDYVLVNNDLQETISRVKAIILAQRLKRTRQPGLESLIDEILNQNI
jgi:guanylate kinase